MEHSRVLVRLACLVVLSAFGTPSLAQQFKTLASFNGYNGMFPYAPLVQGADGNFYGTTVYGGKPFSPTFVEGGGTVLEVSPRGSMRMLYSFCSVSNCADGLHPVAGLVLASDGNLYGTTEGGGAYGYGTVFRITTEGQLTVLHSFAGGATDGAYPMAGLVQASDGNFYGTTSLLGPSYGTVFKITPTGELTTLYSFFATNSHGYLPTTGLVQASDGNLYGTTQYNNISGGGTIFKISLNGNLTTIYTFCLQSGCSDGYWPLGTLIQGSDGNLYGTTLSGGVSSLLCSGGETCGTVFKITPSGKLTTLHKFDGSDGEFPSAGLIQGANGDFYGTTLGTAFRMTRSGELSTLYTFCAQTNCADGDETYAGLVQSTDGKLYGTNVYGGNSSNCKSWGIGIGCGVVFGLSVGLEQPSVETSPSGAKAGPSVMIPGNNLTDSTGIKFNGMEASSQLFPKPKSKR